jgi:epoxyqueuosine reductase QueG
MGKMNVVLKDEIETKFRKAVFERKGMKKGNISEALEEAIEQWIRTTYHKEEKQNARQQ